jgi:uncharacterized protein YbjT (DUF2867 family)
MRERRPIVVAGAIGHIGGEVVRLLAEAGETVRAISRHPPQEPSGVEWVAADLVDRRSLEQALAGADSLLLVTGNSEDMVRAQKNAVAVAVQTGVRHIVKVSALGASDHSKSVIGVWHWVVEQALEQADVEWTILRPHVFMQNILAQAKAIMADGIVRSPAADAAVPMIDTRDIAAVAAAALTGTGHAGKRYTLTGPTPITWQNVAAVLSDVLARRVECASDSLDDTWRRLRDGGTPIWLIAGQLALAEYQRAGGGTAIVTETVRQVTGRPPRSFRDFVQDHAAVFRRRV